VGKLAEAYVDIKGRDMGLKTAMATAHRDVTTGAAGMQASMDKTAAGIAASAKKIVGWLLAIGAAAAAVGAGKSAIKLAADWEQAELAFTTMLGSAEKARGFMAELEEFAKKTPFELPGLIDGARRLMAYGFAAEEVLPTLTAIGDAISGMGGGEFEINRLVRALGQIRAKGRLASQEMLQITELGIPAWELLADKIGVSIPEAMKLVERRAISSGDAIDAILTGIAAKFPNMMEKQSKTLTGLWSTLKDTIGMILRKVGMIIVEAFDLKGVLAGVTRFGDVVVEIMTKLRPYMEQYGKQIKEVAVVLKDEFVKVWQEHGPEIKRLMEAIIKLGFHKLAADIKAVGLAVRALGEAVRVLMKLPQVQALMWLLGRFGGLKAPAVTKAGTEGEKQRQKASEDADDAAEDARAAEAVLYDLRVRNASEMTKLELEYQQALAQAKGPKHAAAIEQDFADQRIALTKKLTDEEAEKQRDLTAKKVAMWEAESRAYGETVANRLRLAGRLYTAERAEALITYKTETTELYKLALTGEEVARRMEAAHTRYLVTVKDIDARQAEERKRQQAEWQAMVTSALDTIIEKERKAAEKIQAVWQAAHDVAGRLAVELTRIIHGETAARIMEIEREADERAKYIRDNIENETAQADLLQALAIVTGRNIQDVLDEVADKQDEVHRDWLAQQREKVGFTTPARMWESAMLRAARTAWAEPPRMEKTVVREESPQLLRRIDDLYKLTNRVLPNIERELGRLTGPGY